VVSATELVVEVVSLADDDADDAEFVAVPVSADDESLVEVDV